MKKLIAILLTIALLLDMAGTTAMAAEEESLPAIPEASWTVDAKGNVTVKLSEGMDLFDTGTAYVCPKGSTDGQEVELTYDKTKKAFVGTDAAVADGTMAMIFLQKNKSETKSGKTTTIDNHYDIEYYTTDKRAGKTSEIKYQKQTTVSKDDKIIQDDKLSIDHDYWYSFEGILYRDKYSAAVTTGDEKGSTTTENYEVKRYDKSSGKYTEKTVGKTISTRDADDNLLSGKDNSKTYNAKGTLVSTDEYVSDVTYNQAKDARTIRENDKETTLSEKGYTKSVKKTAEVTEEKKPDDVFEIRAYKKETKTTNRDGILAEHTIYDATYEADEIPVKVSEIRKTYSTYTKALTEETVINGSGKDGEWAYTATFTENNDDGSLRRKTVNTYDGHPDAKSNQPITETHYNKDSQVVATKDKDGTWKDGSSSVIGKNVQKDSTNYETTTVSFKLRTGEISGYTVQKSEEATDGTVTMTRVTYSNGEKTTDRKTVSKDGTYKRYEKGVMRESQETKDGVTEIKFFDVKGNLSSSIKKEGDTTTTYDYRGKMIEKEETKDGVTTVTEYDPVTEKMTGFTKEYNKDGDVTEYYGADSKLRWSEKATYADGRKTTVYSDAEGKEFAKTESLKHDSEKNESSWTALYDGLSNITDLDASVASLEKTVETQSEEGNIAKDTYTYTKWDSVKGEKKNEMTRKVESVTTTEDGRKETNVYNNGVLTRNDVTEYNDYDDEVKFTRKEYDWITGKATGTRKNIYRGIVDENEDDPMRYYKRYDKYSNLQEYSATDNTDEWAWKHAYYADGTLKEESWDDYMDGDSSYTATYWPEGGPRTVYNMWSRNESRFVSYNPDGTYSKWSDTKDGVTNTWQYNWDGELTGYRWNEQNKDDVYSYDQYDAAGNLRYSYKLESDLAGGSVTSRTDPEGNKWSYNHETEEVTLTLANKGSGWQVAVGQWFYVENGKPVQDEWRKIDGAWYYFEKTGFLRTGIVYEESEPTKAGEKVTYKTYAIDMNTGALTLGGWTMVNDPRDDDGDEYGWAFTDVNGEVLTGWQNIGGQWYYFSDGWTYGADAQYKEEVDWAQEGFRGFMATGAAQVWNSDWTDKHTYFFHKDGTWDNSPGWKMAYFDGNVEYHYYDRKGNEVTGWQKIDGDWYFFNTDGVMKNGWVKSGTNWYFMDPKQGGAMAASGWAEDVYEGWYYMDKNGQYQTGWLNDGGEWYYLKGDGAMAENEWTKYGGCWYYLGGDGSIETGWVQDHGSWYYLKQDGAMKTGWVGEGSTWYYMGEDGAMVADTDVTVDGKTYHFDETGLCTNP